MGRGGGAAASFTSGMGGAICLLPRPTVRPAPGGVCSCLGDACPQAVAGHRAPSRASAHCRVWTAASLRHRDSLPDSKPGAAASRTELTAPGETPGGPATRLAATGWERRPLPSQGGEPPARSPARPAAPARSPRGVPSRPRPACGFAPPGVCVGCPLAQHPAGKCFPSVYFEPRSVLILEMQTAYSGRILSTEIHLAKLRSRLHGGSGRTDTAAAR